MKFTAIAINHEHGVTISNVFTMHENQSPDEFKAFILEKLSEEMGALIDEIFILPCGKFVYHYTDEDGWATDSEEFDKQKNNS